jgi:GTP-binding protein HflX
MRSLTTVIELLIPYDRGDIVATVHREGEVVSTANEESGMRVRARLADASAGRLNEFVVNK